MIDQNLLYAGVAVGALAVAGGAMLRFIRWIDSAPLIDQEAEEHGTIPFGGAIPEFKGFDQFPDHLQHYWVPNGEHPGPDGLWHVFLGAKMTDWGFDNRDGAVTKANALNIVERRGPHRTTRRLQYQRAVGMIGDAVKYEYAVFDEPPAPLDGWEPSPFIVQGEVHSITLGRNFIQTVSTSPNLKTGIYDPEVGSPEWIERGRREGTLIQKVTDGRGLFAEAYTIAADALTAPSGIEALMAMKTNFDGPLELATGKDLDDRSNGLIRLEGEPDADFRQRIMDAALRPPFAAIPPGEYGLELGDGEVSLVAPSLDNVDRRIVIDPPVYDHRADPKPREHHYRTPERILERHRFAAGRWGYVVEMGPRDDGRHWVVLRLKGMNPVDHRGYTRRYNAEHAAARLERKRSFALATKG